MTSWARPAGGSPQSSSSKLAGIDKRIKAANNQLRELAEATGSTLLELSGIGPCGAARLLGDIGDVSRFGDPRALRLVERHRPDRRVLR